MLLHLCLAIRAEKEGDFIRALGDPRLPSQEEVDKHYLVGHITYRSWCHVRVKTKRKELDHFGGRR